MQNFQSGLLYFAAAGVAFLLGAFGLERFSPQDHSLYENQLHLAGALSEVMSERVTDLPEDGQAWHTVFVLHDKKGLTDARDRKLLANFASDPTLQSLLAQTVVWKFDERDPLYERYAPLMGNELPQVWLIQTQEGRDAGKAVYKASGEATQVSARQLASEISTMVERCPRPNPQPAPGPGPQPSLIPDLRPLAPSSGMGEAEIWGLLGVLAASGIGFAIGQRE